MDYVDIGPGLKKYIRKSTYVGMSRDDRELYLKYARKLLHKLEQPIDSEEETLIEKFSDVSLGKYVSNAKKSNRSSHRREITFVGMRYHGNHRFSTGDVLQLRKEDDNPVDSNAVNVMLRDGKWKHVANVAREDAKWLRTVDDFEELPLAFICSYNASATYYIQLE